MRLLKPSWVTLDEKPIFSIDIHPDGSRFATGGQGDDCGKVVIWNMAAVRDEKFEKDETIPKILCQMDNHLGCVNCVRWSHSGRHLASGGDDKLVMIWQTSRYGGPSTVFGSGGKMVNIEQWRPVSTLRGHTGDVLDLAWSPHDAWLATCSVDNTVVVWNALKFPEQICVLKGHSGLVKGVTWDPVGKYLASQSDDKSLRIWRTGDWQQEAVVTEPFQECSATTHILRLNWSPDGHYVVSAHAMNNSGPTAQIIERDGWKTSMDFVGHRKAITVVRFNPNILSMKVKKELDKPQQYTCCAIGSRDRSLSIWLTALKRPLVVTHDLFTNSILDISWSKCGMELLCCSWDGTVAFIDFTADEIGNPLSQQEVRNLHERIYGKSLALSNLVNPGSQIIESGALLNLRQQQAREAAERNAQKQNSNQSPLVNGKSPFKARKLDRICEPTDKQIETRTADGRRRITPIYLAPQPDMGQSCENGDIPPYDANSNSDIRKNSMDSQINDLPLPFSTKNITFTSSTEQSKIVIEKQDRVTGPGLSQSSSRSSSDNSSPITTHAITPSANTVSESRDTKLKSGIESHQPADVQDKEKIGENNKISEKEKFREKITEKAKAAMERHAVIDDKKSRLKPTLPVKRKLEGTGRVGRPRKYPLLNQTALQSTSTMLNAKEDPSRPVRFDADVHLPQITIEKSFSKQVAGRLADHNAVILEVENNVHVGMVTVHKLRCSKGGAGTSWEQILTSRVLIVAGSRYLACAACEDKSITFLTSGGRKVYPSLILNAKLSMLDCNGHYVMAITQKGRLYVWNMQKKCSVIKNETLNIIMSESDTITKAQITKEGVPIISLSNNKTYSFSSDFGSWIWVTSKLDPLQKQSDHHSCIPVSEGTKVVGTLASLQASQEKSGLQASRMYRSSNSIHQTSTLSHLANQVSACLALKSSSEYKFWLLTYIRYLVQEGIEPKLREICDELLGPGYVKNRKDNWEEYVVGLKKRDIMTEILPIIGSNLRFQRLFTEYQDQLSALQ